MTLKPLPEEAQLFIFCALHCEAKPIIDFLGLKKIPESRIFDIYKHLNISLTITGIGKSSMAAGVAYSLAINDLKSPIVLLNIGIAGHMSAQLGRLFIAEKITDVDSAKSYYPQMLPDTYWISQALQTVSQPQLHYASDHLLYDMEASAFYEVGTRFTSSELILAAKIVSDNAQSPIAHINAKLVTDLIATQVETISLLIKLLLNRSRHLIFTEVNYFEDWTKLHHFTVSEKIQLKALLARWDILSGNSEQMISPLEFKTTRAFLDELNARVNSLPVLL
jgi:adenosylhomocysteine nucleosidase